MSDKKSKKKNDFTKLDKTFTAVEFKDLSKEALAATPVDCPTCPVSMLCMAASSSENSAQSICVKCNTASLSLTTKTENDEPGHVLLVDCTKNNFRSNKKDEGEGCLLCNGRFVKPSLLTGLKQDTPYVLPTVHSKEKVAARQKSVQDSWEFWGEQVRLRDEAIKKVAAEAQKQIDAEIAKNAKK
jgi:hypothetical protein